MDTYLSPPRHPSRAKVFQQTRHPVLRFVWTGLISVAAVVACVIIASMIVAMIRR
jgi:hypothetical protein